MKSQLLNVPESYLFACELFSDRLFQTIEQIPSFQQKKIVTSSLRNSIRVIVLYKRMYGELLPSLDNDYWCIVKEHQTRFSEPTTTNLNITV